MSERGNRSLLNRTCGGKIILVLIIIGIMIFSALTFYNYKHRSYSIEVEIEKLYPSALITKLNVTGVTKASDMLKLRTPIAGQIKTVHVKEGQAVSKGQVLISFDDKALKQAELVSRQAEAQLLQAKLRFEEAKKKYNYQRQLYYRGEISSEQLEQTLMQVNLADAQMMQSDAAYRYTLIDFNNINVNKNNIIAPKDGYILQILTEEGASVSHGMHILSMGNPVKLSATLAIDENDIMAIKLGNKVRINIDNLGGESLGGLVSEISPHGNMQNNLQVFMVKVDIDNNKQKLLPGMSIDAEIITNYKENIITLPRQAVHEEQSEVGRQMYVYINDNNRAKKRYVKTGVRNETRIEIVSGLEYDEEVIVGDLETVLQLKDGEGIINRKEEKKTKFLWEL